MSGADNATAFWQRVPSQRRLVDWQAALAAGEFTPVEALEALIERAGSIPDVTATAFVDFDADTLREGLKEIGRDEALAGLPVSIKDLFDVRGEVTGAGSKVLADATAATRDAPAVVRLRRAGALLTGRTTMSEFAFSGLGLNSYCGTPPNPFDAERITGGSTSGGAASIAFGLAAATLGSDTGGSLRIPAAFCGLTGFKPSQTSVPGEGAYPLAPSLDCVGPIAPSVDCCARLWSVLAATPMPTLDPTPRPLRLAVPVGGLLEELDDTVRDGFEAAIARLEAAGCHVERLTFEAVDGALSINQQGGLVVPEAAALHREQLERAQADYDPLIAERLTGGRDVSATDYLQRLWPRAGWQQRFGEEMSGFDAVLLPTVATLPPKRIELENDAAAFQRANRLALRNTSVFNYLDAASISLPFFTPKEALPIGLMLSRPQGQDCRLLQHASVVEAMLAS
ncbi:amidase [Kushneria indalinina]|uniref:Aspartyl-tRNA(Asn)/glutamyl-tRNA(Gln) amidotransferase subunit A n=1 Tax=Kushneria indalinina DSM 14324 TaxID=1122140 RepID=A0A3D9DT60_9GAMM|nr:amidase [Kushneria indalinina]REC93960.1 aspartyl-tRNA(Asn)/glutamyl-tRNA(Gln) amidotransferase subunit A [Kushneria indalinina DSM 14324]